MEFHFGVRLLDRAVLHASFHNSSKNLLFGDILALTRPGNNKHLQCRSGQHLSLSLLGYTLTGASIKWMRLDCGFSLPIRPIACPL